MTGPIVIRGQSFPDEAAVAAAFGIQPVAVRRALRKGRGEFIGIPAHLTRHRHGPEPFAVRIRGKLYPNVKAAARAFNVSEITIRNAIHRGREDFVGLGSSRKHSKASVGKTPGNAKEVRIGSLTFPSVRALARFAGLSSSTVYEHVRNGSEAILLAHVMRAQARQEGHRKKLPDPVHGVRKDPSVFRLGYERREAAA